MGWEAHTQGLRLAYEEMAISTYNDAMNFKYD